MKLSALTTLLAATLVSSATLDKRYVVNPPGATQGAAISTCNRWDYVGTGVTCTTIASKYGYAASRVVTYNPFLNSACTNMWLGYWVCSGVSSASATSGTPPATSVAARAVPVEMVTITVQSPVTCSCPSLTYTTTETVTVTAGL